MKIRKDDEENETFLKADLSGDEKVDFVDYSILADYWLDYCPDDWTL